MKKLASITLLLLASLSAAVAFAAAPAQPVGAVINSPPTPTLSNTPDPRMPQVKQRYTANLKKWQAKRLQNYSFTLQRSCFCTPEYTTPMLVTVQDGKVLSAVTESLAVALKPDGSEAAPTMVDVTDRAMSVDQLFNEIKQAIDNGAATIDVKYDPTWGYPRSISIDLDKRMADEELAFTSTNLKPAIRKPVQPSPGMVCPMDMKTCPDGSMVGRTAPGCTFAACPTDPAVSPVVGGYMTRAVTDADVVSAAKFAASKLGTATVKTILKAESQVVAGTNYRLSLLLSDGKAYPVTVFRGLDGSMQLK